MLGVFNLGVASRELKMGLIQHRILLPCHDYLSYKCNLNPCLLLKLFLNINRFRSRGPRVI